MIVLCVCVQLSFSGVSLLLEVWEHDEVRECKTTRAEA